jgi:HAD superfamily hydrolase (TIGR01490 family)
MQESKKSSRKSQSYKSLSIFDLDRTLVSKNTSFSFYFFLIRKGLLPLSTLFRAIPLFFLFQKKKVSLRELHKNVFSAFLKGKKKALFTAAAPLFLKRFLARRLNRAVFDRFEQSKKRGERTCLLSSSPDFLVAPIAQQLGFDLWCGTEYAVDKEERLCEISSLIEGRSKLDYAMSFLSKRITAYSDSEDDLPLLEWADEAIVVNPNRFLRKWALKKKWEVL